MKAHPMRGPGEKGRARWITITGLVAVVGVAGAIVFTFARRGPEGSLSGMDPEGDEVIERALAQALPDSTAIKTAWVDEVPDVALDDLPPSRKELFLRLVNSRNCTCGCGYTLGACRSYDPTCEVSGPLVAALLDSVRVGHTFDGKDLRERPK